MDLDLIGAFEDGDYKSVVSTLKIIDRSIKNITNGIDEEDYYDGDINLKQILEDKLEFKPNFKAAIQGYRKDKNKKIIEICLNRNEFLNKDFNFAIEELIYENNNNDDLTSIIKLITNKCASIKYPLNNALSAACDIKSFDLIFFFLHRGLEDSYAIQCLLNLDQSIKIDHDKLFIIMQNIYFNRKIFRLIRLLGSKKHILFYYIQNGFSPIEFDVVLNHFIDNNTINKIFTLIRKLMLLK